MIVGATGKGRVRRPHARGRELSGHAPCAPASRRRATRLVGSGVTNGRGPSPGRLRHEIHVGRVYDSDDRTGAGYRVLVDRLWPRGMTKADAAVDEWSKMSRRAPSCGAGTATTSRDFTSSRVSLTAAELRHPPASVAVQRLIELAKTRTIFLLTATRDVEHSGARVLQQSLTRRVSR